MANTNTRATAGAGGNGHRDTGRVVQVLGGVVDCEFPPEQLPELFDAIEVERPGQSPLVLEVQKHMGHNWVRCVAMDTTDGLRRGVPAVGTGAPISVPVGEATLGEAALWAREGSPVA